MYKRVKGHFKILNYFDYFEYLIYTPTPKSFHSPQHQNG